MVIVTTTSYLVDQLILQTGEDSDGFLRYLLKGAKKAITATVMDKGKMTVFDLTPGLPSGRKMS